MGAFIKKIKFRNIFMFVIASSYLIISAAGCGNDAEKSISNSETVESQAIQNVDGFEKAEYERYNSPAEENGLYGTNIYIYGTVEDKYVEDQILALILKQDDGGKWIVSVTNNPDNDIDIVNKIIGKEVRVLGEYIGYSEVEKLPAVVIATDNGRIDKRNEDGTYEKYFSFSEYYASIVNKEDSSTGSDKEDNIETEEMTLSQKNAINSANQYLNFSSFSYEGLINQLEYEKYSHEDAVYAADNCGADWNEQAVKSAKQYLNFSAFSYDGLVRQLESEKFTNEQAIYGAEHCEADWNEQAAKSAEQYLDMSSFSRDRLIEQLEYEGFTHEQAVYGVEAIGY